MPSRESVRDFVSARNRVATRAARFTSMRNDFVRDAKSRRELAWRFHERAKFRRVHAWRFRTAGEFFRVASENFSNRRKILRRINDEAERWTAAIDELRALLKGLVGTNLQRRHSVGLASLQSYSITRQLVRHADHADLQPHLEEMKRNSRRSRKPKPTAPAPTTTPAPTTSEQPTK